MAHSLQTIGQLAFPRPLAVRVLASVARSARALQSRLVQRTWGFSGPASLSPVSAKWLSEHEVSRSKHLDDA